MTAYNSNAYYKWSDERWLMFANLCFRNWTPAYTLPWQKQSQNRNGEARYRPDHVYLLHPFLYYITTHTLAFLQFLLPGVFISSVFVLSYVPISTHLCLDDKICTSYMSCQLTANKPWLDLPSASLFFSVLVLKSLNIFISVAPYISHSIRLPFMELYI